MKVQPLSPNPSTQTATLVDHGRGVQLSSSRITVMDLVPYFQDGCSHEEIMRWIPILTLEEIALLEKYYREHKEEYDERDRRLMAYRKEQRRLQALRFPQFEVTHKERMARLKKLADQRRREKNGQGNPG